MTATVALEADGPAVEPLPSFLARAEAFLTRTTAPLEATGSRWGEGSDAIGILEEADRDHEVERLDQARRWRAVAFDAGFGWISGPAAYGGAGLPPNYEREFRRLAARFAVPNQSVFAVGLGMVAPAILHHGTDALRSAYLRRLFRGDVLACQLFSEPEAGSDLAGVRTRATRDGDRWVVNGQKVWSSGAHLSDVGELLARTDPDAAKHQGLTMFLLDMRQPGIDVRPLRQMTGGAWFNEVFLTDVQVPDDHRIGPVGGGWTVALTTLMSERATVGDGSATRRAPVIERLGALVQYTGRAGDPLVRQALADVVIGERVLRMYEDYRRAGRPDDVTPGPEMSIAKLLFVAQLRRVCALVGHLLGPRLVADTGEWGTYAWAEYVLGAPGLRIAGGTDEIMRNILGERVLGLPKDTRC